MLDEVNTEDHDDECSRDNGHGETVLGLLEMDVDQVVLHDKGDQEEEIEFDQNQVHFVGHISHAGFRATMDTLVYSPSVIPMHKIRAGPENKRYYGKDNRDKNLSWLDSRPHVARGINQGWKPETISVKSGSIILHCCALQTCIGDNTQIGDAYGEE